MKKEMIETLRHEIICNFPTVEWQHWASELLYEVYYGSAEEENKLSVGFGNDMKLPKAWSPLKDWLTEHGPNYLPSKTQTSP